MRSAAAVCAPLAALIVAACSGGPPLPSLSTGSLGGSSTPAAANASGTGAAAAETAVKNDPTQRAFQVGATSARAVKCGFHFDPVRLKQQFLAAEATQGTADMVKVEKIYDVSFNGISRGIAEKQDYCADAKTKEIKEDLNRHLVGDYSPRQVKQVAKEDGGFFGNLFDNEEVEKGPKMGTDEWWEAQRNKAGGR